MLPALADWRVEDIMGPLDENMMRMLQFIWGQHLGSVSRL